MATRVIRLQSLGSRWFRRFSRKCARRQAVFEFVAKIPGEILDLLVVRTEVLQRADGSGARFAKAITGAWYETVAQAGVAVPGPKQKLSPKQHLQRPRVIASAPFVKSSYVTSIRSRLRSPRCSTSDGCCDWARDGFWCGSSVQAQAPLARAEYSLSGTDVAIRYPDGSVQGKSDRVRLRVDSSYMHMAEQGKLYA